MSIKDFFRKIFYPSRHKKKYPLLSIKKDYSNSNSVLEQIQSIPTEQEDIQLADLKLSQRIINALQAEGIFCLKDLAKLTTQNMFLIPNIGNKSLIELKTALQLLKSYPSQKPHFIDSNLIEDKQNLEIYFDIAEKKFEDQNLSARLINALKSINVFQIKDLFSITEKQLYLTPNMGAKTLQELKDFLSKNGVSIGKKYKILNQNSPQKVIDGTKILSFETFIFSNFNERTAKIIIERYDGKTLEEIAQRYNLSRERIRQICNKLNWKKQESPLKEDKYLPIFRKYAWKEIIFCKVFQEKKICFNYLNHRYGKGQKPLRQSLKDENLTDQQKFEITSFLNNKKTTYRPLSKGKQ